MQTSLSRLCQRATIIGLLLLALTTLGGCSAVRLGYNQGPQLGHWWLDGYLDFNGEQSPRVKAGLEQWFIWHRATQLGDYAALLADVKGQLAAPVTPAQVCRLSDELRARIEPAVERALPLAAELVPTLTPAQLERLEQRYAKGNAEYRKDYFQPRADERLKASVERTVDRLESFYGKLDTSQRAMVAAGAAASPADPEARFAEREGRQRDVLRTLSQLVAERAGREQALPALRQLARRLQASPPADAAAQAKAQQVTQYNCDLGARLHNTMSAAQREHARAKLAGWEEDLRALAAELPPAQARFP
jgi:uncharacterized coiled-coil protein SlyX